MLIGTKYFFIIMNNPFRVENIYQNAADAAGWVFYRLRLAMAEIKGNLPMIYS